MLFWLPFAALLAILIGCVTIPAPQPQLQPQPQPSAPLHDLPVWQF